MRTFGSLFSPMPHSGKCKPYLLTIMGLFSFAQPTDNNNSDNGQEIQLVINDEQITVPAAEASNMTVRQVFERFAGGIADLTRINRFVALGRIVGGDSVVEPGTVYTAAINSETKG